MTAQTLTETEGAGFGVSFDFAEETPEAKARWFRSLTTEERMELLCAFTNLIMAANPKIAEAKDARPIEGRVCVLELP